MTTYINTDGRIYLIAFRCTTTKFICNNSSALIKCLKENDRHRSLKYIKVFDATKEKFTRASQDTLKTLLIWDAESTEYLSNHYYFKS